jgi:hypothetical protein
MWINKKCIKEGMVHPRGFEPLTARFVAEYSIQLSYGCIAIYSHILFWIKQNVFFEMVHPRGFEPLTARFVAEYSIQLSYGCTTISFSLFI